MSRSDGVQEADARSPGYALYAVAFKLHRLESPALHWAYCLDVTNAPDPTRISGLLYDVQGVFGAPLSYHFKERLTLGCIPDAPDFLAAVHIGEVEEDSRSVFAQTLESVPIVRMAGQDGVAWFERALDALVKKGFVMPELDVSWIHAQVLEAADERGVPINELPDYLRFTSAAKDMREMSISPRDELSAPPDLGYTGVHPS